MGKHLVRALLVVGVVGATESLAQEPPPPPPPPPDEVSASWTLYGGRTAGVGTTLVGPELGWPGIGASVVYGVSERFDLGGRFAFDYGTDLGVFLNPALHLQGVLRLRLLDQRPVSVGLRFEPGIGFYFLNGAGMLLHFPVELDIGIHPTEALTVLLGLGVQTQVVVGFQGLVLFAVPIFVANPGIEYRVTDTLALTFRTGFGPSVGAVAGNAVVDFTFRVMLGLAIKI